MTLEEAQKRVEELMIENKKLKNRVDFLEKAMYDDIKYYEEGDDYEDNNSIADYDYDPYCD